VIFGKNADKSVRKDVSEKAMIVVARRKPLIVGLGGTTRARSSSASAMICALKGAAELGANTEFFDGPQLMLPMYSPDVSLRTAEAQRLLDALRMADGIILASPGYHGSITGLLKNALDYVEDLRNDARPYFENRAVGCIVCAAGWQAVGTALIALRTVVHALRGWPTPLGVGINTVGPTIFEGDLCTDPAIASQLRTVAGQVVQYASRSIAHEDASPIKERATEASR